MHARTSQIHPLQIDTLGPVGRGRLELTFCPGKQDLNAQTGAWDRDVGTDLRAVLGWGASTVVALMETYELELLRATHLGEHLRRRLASGEGIVVQYPGPEPTRARTPPEAGFRPSLPVHGAPETVHSPAPHRIQPGAGPPQSPSGRAHPGSASRVDGLNSGDEGANLFQALESLGFEHDDHSPMIQNS